MAKSFQSLGHSSEAMWNRGVGMFRFFLGMLLAALSFSIQSRASAEKWNGGDLFHNCEVLSEAKIFKSLETKAYFLATDTCMESVLSSLGLKEAKSKPRSIEFVNAVSLTGGTPERVLFYSEKLKLIFQAPDATNVVEKIVGGLGLKWGEPADSFGYTLYSADVIPFLNVCCETETKQVKSCGQLKPVDYFNGEIAYWRCQR